MSAKYLPIKDDKCYLIPDAYDGPFDTSESVTKCAKDPKDVNLIIFFDEEAALIKLLQEEVCFFGSFWHPDKHMKEKGAYLGIGVFVNCNDLFYWACADGESLDDSDVEYLYRCYLTNNNWGGSIWACKKRNLQPQVPMKKDMIKDGVWTDELEALPKPEPS